MSCEALVDQCLREMAKGRTFLAEVPNEVYTTPMGPRDNTIGQQIRHTLDMSNSYVKGIPSRRVDLTVRKRDPEVEQSPITAIRYSLEIETRLEGYKGLDKDTPIVQITMNDHGTYDDADTTIGAALQGMISHIHHHYAIIAVMAHQLGYEITIENFGVNPSSL